MADSAPPAPAENQVTAGPGAKSAVKSHEEDLGKITGALAKRDHAKLREEVTSYLAKLAREHAGAGLVALGLGAAAGPVGGLAAGFLVQWLSARFEVWIKYNSADEKLKKAVEDSKDDAERRLLLRDIRAWLAPTLDTALSELELHSEALLAVIEQNDRHEAKLKEVLSRVPDPAADTLAALLQARRLELPVAPSPAQLLDARYGAVPFDMETRKAELAALQLLCDADGHEQVEMQLLVGPGGAGKTRLAMQFCDHLWGRTDAHWHAGFLLQEAQAHAIPLLTRPGCPTLIVIDYAEGRTLGPWLKQLMNMENARPKLRILLLARHAGEWWETLAQGDAAVKHLCRHPVIRLQDVVLDDGARQRHYDLARTALVDKLHKSGSTLAVPKLDEARYARPLYVHMAALSTILDAPFPDVSSHAHALPWEMVQRESVWWEPTSDGLPWGLLRLMAAVTLLGGASTKQFKRLRKDLELVADENLRARLGRYYPKEKGVGALEPDLLGEALVVHALQHDDTDEDFLDVALKDASSDQLLQALTVLGRIAPEHPKQARQWVRKIFDESPLERADAAFRATLAVSEKHVDDVLGQELAHALDGYTSLDLANAWSPQLPHETVAFREVKLWVYKQLAAAAEDDKSKANHGASLGIALSALGRREEAVAATAEAVAAYKQLAQDRPDAFLSDLARTLHNLGMMQSNLGRHEEALVTTKEAVAIYKQLAQDQPNAFLSDLATALINLGGRLSDLGQREEALATTEEAVAIYKPLAQDRPDAFLPDLARALNDLGMMQSNLGRHEEALATTEEAVAIYKPLALDRPDAFLSDLARTLNNLGMMQSNLGRHEEALATTEEAVAIYKPLAQDRPDAFLPDLAVAFDNLGMMLSNLGRREEALATTEEAVAIYKPLAQNHPDAFLPNLAKALNNLGAFYSNLGRREEALAAVEEAIAIYKPLAQNHPDAFLPDLARALNNLGAFYSSLERREEALAASEEAIAIYKPLAQNHPDAFLPDLARALNNLGVDHDALGKREEALATTEEAVAIYRPLAQDRPDAFLPDLARALNNLGAFYCNLGRHEEALASIEEAVAIYKPLAQDRPDAFLSELARTLWNMALRLDENSRTEEALKAAQESLSIYEALARRWPDAFGGYLFTIQEIVNLLSSAPDSPSTKRC